MLPVHVSSNWHFFAKSTRTRSNFNYGCLTVYSLFFQNSFIGTQVAISSEIHQEFCKIPSLAMNDHTRHLNAFWNWHKKIKNRKYVKYLHCVIICDLVFILYFPYTSRTFFFLSIGFHFTFFIYVKNIFNACLISFKYLFNIFFKCLQAFLNTCSALHTHYIFFVYIFLIYGQYFFYKHLAFLTI